MLRRGGGRGCMKRREQHCMEWTHPYMYGQRHLITTLATDLDVIINCPLGKASGKNWATMYPMRSFFAHTPYFVQ